MQTQKFASLFKPTKLSGPVEFTVTISSRQLAEMTAHAETARESPDRTSALLPFARPRMRRRPELIAEIVIRAFSLRGAGLIVRALDTVCYCGNCYTTLGMGKVDVGEHWRFINPHQWHFRRFSSRAPSRQRRTRKIR